MLNFHSEPFAEHIMHLIDKDFQLVKLIHQKTTNQLGLANQLWGRISIDAQDRFFAIEDMTFRELTLEVLTSFHLLHPYRGREVDDVVQFWEGTKRCTMSIIQFSQLLGLYDINYCQTPEYSALPLSDGLSSDAFSSLLTRSHRIQEYLVNISSHLVHSPPII